jgi:PAP2 superfamily
MCYSLSTGVILILSSIKKINMKQYLFINVGKQFKKLNGKWGSFMVMLVMFPYMSCEKIEPHAPKLYPPDVAVIWMNMQLRLTKGTTGFNSVVSNRSYAYVGLTLYESIAQGIPGYRSIASQLNGSLVVPKPESGKKYFWPASANAALAFISKNIFANTTASLVSAIDSLESDFHNKFQTQATVEEIQRSAEYGKQVAAAIFEWSKTDGGHEAYNKITSDSYIPPIGPGLWVPTPPAFSKPFHPTWGTNRTFIPGLTASTQPDPPPSYSEAQGSGFFIAMSEIYTISQSLSREDSVIAKFWADLPANYNVPAHAANIVSQLVLLKKLSLPEAALLYCKHGIAGNEAIISCYKTKYQYNVVRPVTCIRNVLGHGNWNSLIPTPAFPEYTSAHAVVSAAMAVVLEDAFGRQFSFTDHTYDNLYGARSFSSFEEYAKEAAMSRLYGGIHYRFAADEGLKQGKKVGALVNKLRFKKENFN